MSVAQGILTATGGRTSHAAVVGRQMGKARGRGAAVPCASIRKERRLEVDGQSVIEGDVISIDGLHRGGDAGGGEDGSFRSHPGRAGQDPPEASQCTSISLRCWNGRMPSAPWEYGPMLTFPPTRMPAMAFGAEGIGLCRTEHMFFAADRIPIVEQMILSTAVKESQKCVDQLLPYQREDFLGLFRAMKGLPVTIRLLDPPLHEFLPKRGESHAADRRADVEKGSRAQEGGKTREGTRSRRAASRVQPDAWTPGLSIGESAIPKLPACRRVPFSRQLPSLPRRVGRPSPRS